jgi:hypothetical protein
MTTNVNSRGLRHARSLIRSGKVARDRHDDWSEYAPEADEENKYIDKHGMREFAKWYLGIDPDEDPENKGAYSFPYGDFNKVHRGGVIAAKVRAAQYDHDEVKKASDGLLKLIDKDKKR